MLLLVVLIMDKKYPKVRLPINYLEDHGETENEQGQYFIYGANQDDLLIPLYVTIHHEADYRLKGYEERIFTLQDRMVYYLFSLLTNNSNHLPKGINPHLPKATKLLDYQIEGEKLTLNVTSNFRYYDPSKETLMLTALLHTLYENLGIEQIKIMVEGEPLQFTKTRDEWLYLQDFPLNPVGNTTHNSRYVVFYYVDAGGVEYLTPIHFYEPIVQKERQIRIKLNSPLSIPATAYPDDCEKGARQRDLSFYYNQLLTEEPTFEEGLNQVIVSLY